MSRKTKTLLILIFSALIIATVIVFNPQKGSQSEVKNTGANPTVKIANIDIKVEEAKSPTQLKKGLSGRKSLGKNEGMLFYLGQKRIAPFWMKDMLFSIDIIWIDEGKIVYIVEKAQPPSGSQIPTYTPDKPATHVLEVTAGFIQKYSIKIGDKVTITN